MQSQAKLPQVLVVDDDPDLLRLIGLLLKRIHCDSIPMANGRSALSWLALENVPELVVLDLMLPDVDGFEVLRHIRSRKELDLIPVVILSAKSDPHTIRYGLDNGADEFISKPYLSNSLTRRVLTLLEEGRKH